MSFEFSIRSFTSIGHLAWTVYKSCKEAPESFNNISAEVLSLHAVLREVEEIISGQQLPPSSQQHLATVSLGCEGVLKDLQALVEKYESLGAQSKRTFDRLKWASNDISELRARLTSNTVLLNTFLSTSQVVVEKKLRKLMQEFREGKRESSIISIATTDSLSQDEKETWRTIRKEFESLGISVAAFDANKMFIMSWFQQAIEDGAFQEHGGEKTRDISEDDITSIINTTDDATSTGGTNYVLYSSLTTPAISKSGIPIPLQGPTTGPLRPPGFEPGSNQGKGISLPPIAQGGSSLRPESEKPTKAISKTRPPRVLTLITWLLRYNKAFYDACRAHQFDRAQELLKKGADINASLKFFTPLTVATRDYDIETCRWLLNNGADVNARDSLGRTPLHQCVFSEELKDGDYKIDIIKLLINKGADLEIRDNGETVMYKASELGRADIVQILLKNGANPRLGTSSPLLIAADYGHADVLELLLNHKVALQLWGLKQLNEALEIAIIKETAQATKITKLLLDHGANLKGIEGVTESYLLRTVKTRDIHRLKLLLSRQVALDFWGVDQLNKALDKALEVAIHHHNTTISYEMVQLLLDHGADINCINSKYLHDALDKWNDALVASLVERGIYITRQFGQSRPTLHIAAASNCLETVKALLARGFDIEDEDDDGFTTLDAVVREYPGDRRFHAMALFLLSQGAIINQEKFALMPDSPRKKIGITLSGYRLLKPYIPLEYRKGEGLHNKAEMR